MRPSSILSEAWANLRTGTSRAATLAALLACTAGSLAVLDARAMVNVLTSAEQFRTAGAATWTLQDAGKIDGVRCQSLDGVSGMRAGALREGRPLHALALPAAQLTTWEVTPGLLEAALTRDLPVSSGVWVSADLATALGVGAGDVLATDAGALLVAGAYEWPDDGRVRTLGYAIVMPVAAAGAFDACWLTTWPPDRDTAGLLYSTAGDSASSPTLAQLNAHLGATLEPRAALSTRLTRWASVAAGAVGLVIGWGSVRSRRLQVASALHARMTPTALAWQHVVETAAWASAAALVSLAATGWAAAAGNPDPSHAVWITASRSIAAACAAAVTGALTSVLTTRERHLHRYFRERT